MRKAYKKARRSGLFLSVCDQVCEVFAKLAIIVHLHEIDVGEVDLLVIAAHAVVVTAEEDILVGDAVFLAVSVQCVELVVRSGSHIEGGGATDEDGVIRECGLDLVIEDLAAAAVKLQPETEKSGDTILS